MKRSTFFATTILAPLVQSLELKDKPAIVDKGGVLLIVSPDLQFATEEELCKINQALGALFLYSVDHWIPEYGVIYYDDERAEIALRICNSIKSNILKRIPGSSDDYNFYFRPADIKNRQEQLEKRICEADRQCVENEMEKLKNIPRCNSSRH